MDAIFKTSDNPSTGIIDRIAASEALKVPGVSIN